MEMALSSNEDSGTDISSNKKLPDLEYKRKVVLLNEDPSRLEQYCSHF